MGISSFGMGFMVGFGSGFFTREALPFARDILRPITRVTVRASVMTFERTREAFSKFGEMVEDTVAEVRHEFKKERHRRKKVRAKPATVAGVERVA